MRSLKFLPHLVMNKNITSGYSEVKLLRETYTLESPRDPCRNRRPGRYSWRVNTPFTRDIIRGRVHIRAHWSRSCQEEGADDFISTSIISCRSRRRLRREPTRVFRFPFWPAVQLYVIRARSKSCADIL